MLQYTKIEKFQAVATKDEKGEDKLIVVGLGSDNWMYQYFGEEGVWNRLSAKYPYQIMLIESPIEPTIEAPTEPQVAPAAPAALAEAQPEAPAA